MQPSRSDFGDEEEFFGDEDDGVYDDLLLGDADEVELDCQDENDDQQDEDLGDDNDLPDDDQDYDPEDDEQDKDIGQDGDEKRNHQSQMNGSADGRHYHQNLRSSGRYRNFQHSHSPTSTVSGTSSTAAMNTISNFNQASMSPNGRSRSKGRNRGTQSSSQRIEMRPNEGPRVTSPYMTKFEKARIIGTRALQISMNAPITIALDGEMDPLLIAEKELYSKTIPFTIRRFLPNGSYEDWNIDQLIID